MSTTTITKSSPELTAYALGELSGEKLATVEHAVKHNPELAAEVAAIRACAAALTAMFKNEPVPTLENAKTVAENKTAILPQPRRWSAIGNAKWLGIAAMLLVVVTLWLAAPSPSEKLLPTPLRERNIAATPIDDEITIGGDEATDNEVMRREKYAGKPEVVTSEKVAARISSAPAEAKKAAMAPQEIAELPVVGDMFINADVSASVDALTDADSDDNDAMNAPIMLGLTATPRLGKLPAKLKSETQNVIRQYERSERFVRVADGNNIVASKDIIADASPELAPRSYAISAAPFNTESYAHFHENEFVRVADEALSTFSIDVDTASYANTRRMLQQGQIPPAGALRLEEFINYFNYDYTPPVDGKPFATHFSAVNCPWNSDNILVRVGLKGKIIAPNERPASNLVFLIDVSGSMDEPHKLPLVREGMKLLVKQLTANDRVAIVVYAGASGLVLPSTTGAEQKKILDAIDNLRAGGSTNGGAGLMLAYSTAAQHFIADGVNRVILCTDGDFNVGATSESAMVELIEKKAQENVFLTILGFGMGNYKDAMLKQLSSKGNGNYGYIDTLAEAKKMLVEQINGTLVTIAKDVKIQVEFNPAQVQAYRLLGYENRKLNKEDFNNDQKDAGDIGAGHTVTAIYELVPVGAKIPHAPTPVDELKYQKIAANNNDGELLTVKLRYKEPNAEVSKLLEFPLTKKVATWNDADNDTRFAVAVAAFAMRLRHSKFIGDTPYPQIIDWANNARGADVNGYRHEFIGLVRQAQSLTNK